MDCGCVPRDGQTLSPNVFTPDSQMGRNDNVLIATHSSACLAATHTWPPWDLPIPVIGGLGVLMRSLNLAWRVNIGPSMLMTMVASMSGA